MTQYWFKPRRYGAGATPVTWQGWATIAAFPVISAVVLLAVFAMLPPVVGFILFAVLVPTAMITFIGFIRKKTDGEWRWRWGGNKPGEI
jgi:hypothetical protein